MIRRVAREMVLQSLFQMDFTQAEPAEALAIALEVQQDEEKSEEAWEICHQLGCEADAWHRPQHFAHGCL